MIEREEGQFFVNSERFTGLPVAGSEDKEPCCVSTGSKLEELLDGCGVNLWSLSSSQLVALSVNSLVLFYRALVASYVRG